MKITVRKDGGQEINIDLPNALLFSPTLLNIPIKFGVSHSDHKIPALPSETTKQICTILKEYSRHHGPLELVRVDSASGDQITITI